MKAETRIAKWRGQEPRLVSITGTLAGYGAQVEALKGARVIAEESRSGYCAMSDVEGRFVLPHLMWYPGACFNLIVSADAHHRKRMELRAPPNYPKDGIVDVGELRFENGYELDREDILVRPMEYDRANIAFYTGLFNRLTNNLETDEQALDAINKYVAAKLNYDEPAREFRTPRQILERGSCYCSNLALAMAAIAAAGDYPTRTIHLSDSPEHRNTHVVVEVYYGDQWHLYDPTYGISFLNRYSEVASYRELRLDPSLVNGSAFRGIKPETTDSVLAWMPDTYRAGFHQIYVVRNSEVCHD